MLHVTESREAPQARRYRVSIVAICVCYFIFQLVYIPHAVLARDELWFAHHIFRYVHALPYRDFAPYKTVLGYYLLSLPLHFAHGMLAPLFYIKDEIALMNTLMLGGMAWWASRWFTPWAIFYTLVILLSSQLFLLYSADLRVDMLASWFCLLSILCLQTGRSGWAGGLLAAGFLVSQKVIWYGLATNGALAILYWLATERRDVRRALVQFNGGLLLTLALYVGIWSCFAGVQTVLHSVFYEAYTQSRIYYYAGASFVYWQAILQDGPLLFLLWPLTLLSLFDVRLPHESHPRRVFMVLYASIALLLMVTYRQFFPYNIVFCVPAFFVLYAEFFSWVLALWRAPAPAPVVIFTARQWYGFLLLYTLGLVGVIGYFRLPLVYLLIVSIPVALWLIVTKPTQWLTSTRRFVLQLTLITVVLVTGVVTPLTRTIHYAYALNGHYQQDMIRLARALLQDEGEYVAGLPLLYDHDPAIAGLKNLIAPALEYLYTAEPALLPVLLPALDMEPRTVGQVLQDLQAKPVKFVVNNDRIVELPPPVLQFLQSEYEHYWGSIYLYSPTIVPTTSHFTLKFTARYQIETTTAAVIIIDGKVYLPYSTIVLRRGAHYSQSAVAYRLRLQPDNGGEMPPADSREECLTCFAKPIVL